MKKLIVAVMVIFTLLFENAYAWVDYEVKSSQSNIQADLRLIETYGNYIFTADTNTVYVYSKDDIDTQMMSFQSSSSANIRSMAVYDNYLIVGYADRICFYDADILTAGDTEEKYLFEISVNKFYIYENYLLVYRNNSVYIYNLSDIADNVKFEGVISDLSPVIFFADNGYIFAVSDDTYSIGVYDAAMVIAEKSVANAYVTMLNRPVYGDILLSISDIAVSGKYAYISTNTPTTATYGNGIWAYDIENNTDGEVCGMYSPRQNDVGTRVTNLFSVNNILFASCQDTRNVQMIDISKPQNMQALAMFDVGHSVLGYNFKYENNVLYICNRQSGIDVVEIMPAYISELNIYNNENKTGIAVSGVSYYAKVAIENYTDRDIKGNLFLAKYNAGRLINVIKADVLSEAGSGKGEFSTDTLTLDDGEEIKAFFWDEKTGVTPYKASTAAVNNDFDIEYNIYVDEKNGSDSFSGTEDAPFASIEKAISKVREYNRFANSDITVWISGGEYNIEKAIEITEEDGGYNGHRIIFKAYGEEKPVIHGGIKVENWEIHDREKGIYRAYEPEATNRQLFVDGERATRARSEGDVTGFVNDGGESGFTCENTEFLSYSDFKNVEFVFARNWVSRRSHPTDITDNGDGTVFVTLDKWADINDVDYKMPAGVLYYENAYELLDEPGEFFVKDGYVYYIPEENTDINQCEVISPVLEELVNIGGDNPMNHAENIVFDGIEFKYTTWRRPNTEQFCDSQNLYPEVPAAAVNIENADNIEFKNCVFSNMGGDGLSIRRTAKDINITGNHFYDFSSRAISIGDWEGSHYTNDNTEIAENILIKNNSIHDVGKEYYGATAISGVWIKDVSVLHNEIYNTPYSGIHFGWGWATHARTNLEGIDISYNYIHDFMQMLGDGGAIYFLGATNCDADNMNTVSYNYLKDGSGGKVIYCDEGSEFYYIYNNVIDNSEFEKNGWYVGVGDTSYAEHNYSTTSNSAGASENILSQIICENGNFPDEAREIIRNSGIEPEYSHLINNDCLYYDEPYDSILTDVAKGVMLTFEDKVLISESESELGVYNPANKSFTDEKLTVDGIIKQAVYADGKFVVYSETDTKGIYSLFDGNFNKLSTLSCDKGQNIYFYNGILYSVSGSGMILYNLSENGLTEKAVFADITGSGVKVYDNGVFVEKDGVISCYDLNTAGKINVVIEGTDVNAAGKDVSLWIANADNGEPVFVKVVTADESGSYSFETNLDKEQAYTVKMNIAGSYYETELTNTVKAHEDGISISTEEGGKYLFEINGESKSDVYVMIASDNRKNMYYVKKITPADDGTYSHAFRVTQEMSSDTEIIINENSTARTKSIKELLHDANVPFNITVTETENANSAELKGCADLSGFGVKTFDVSDSELRAYTEFPYDKDGSHEVVFDLSKSENGCFSADAGDFNYPEIISKIALRPSERVYAESNNYYFKVNGTSVDVYDKKTDSVIGNIKKEIHSLGIYYTIRSMTVKDERLYIYYAQTKGYGNQNVGIYDVSEISDEIPQISGLGINSNNGEIFSNDEYIFIACSYYGSVRIFKFDEAKNTLVNIGSVPDFGTAHYADNNFLYVSNGGKIKIHSLLNISSGMNKEYLGFIPSNLSGLNQQISAAFTGDSLSAVYNDSEYNVNPEKSTIYKNGEIIQKTYGINEDISMLINNGYLYVWENGQKIYIYDLK